MKKEQPHTQLLTYFLVVCLALAALTLLIWQQEGTATPLLGKFYENVGIPEEITPGAAVALSLIATVMSAITLMILLERRSKNAKTGTRHTTATTKTLHQHKKK